MKKAVFKYNGGDGALLCSDCGAIIKSASQFSDKEMSAMRGEADLPPKVCDSCGKKLKVRNSKSIVFNLKERSAMVRLTKGLAIFVDENTEFCYALGGGYCGYSVKGFPLSSKVARQIIKYLSFDKSELSYDVYKINFNKLYE